MMLARPGPSVRRNRVRIAVVTVGGVIIALPLLVIDNDDIRLVAVSGWFATYLASLRMVASTEREITCIQREERSLRSLEESLSVLQARC
jgi:hypothetical protein